MPHCSIYSFQRPCTEFGPSTNYDPRFLHSNICVLSFFDFSFQNWNINIYIWVYICYFYQWNMHKQARVCGSSDLHTIFGNMVKLSGQNEYDLMSRIWYLYTNIYIVLYINTLHMIIRFCANDHFIWNSVKCACANWNIIIFIIIRTNIYLMIN